MNKRGIAILLALLFSLLIISCSAEKKNKNSKSGLQNQERQYQLRPFSGKLSIPVNKMIELDNLTKKEVYEIRESYVFEHPELISKEYAPSEEVFGGIVDNKPWWGIMGIYYHGNGEHSIDGPSEESRLICNPYLLVGVIETGGFKMSGVDPIMPFYPRALSIFWQGQTSKVIVKYDVSRYFNGKLEYHCPPERIVTLVAYNARDMGLRYIGIIPEGSKNIKAPALWGKCFKIPQYIHLGGSCGYPGGGNNMSPPCSELDVEIPSCPAVARIALWKNEPKNPGKDRPDIIEILQMK